MPIYEYLCETCDHKFEVKQKFSDPPVDSCIKCGESVRKLISAPGIMFKGTGWYVTDYSDKLKDPTQASPNKDKEVSKEKSETSQNGSEPGASKGTPESGSGTTASNNSGTSPASKDANSSSSSTPSGSTTSSSASTSTSSKPSSS